MTNNDAVPGKPSSDQIAHEINLAALRAAFIGMVTVIALDSQLSVKEKIDALNTINYTFGIVTGGANEV